MRIYQFSPAGIETTQRKARWRIVPMMVLIAGAPLFYFLRDPVPIARLIPVLVVVALAIPFAASRALRQNLKTLQAMRVVLDQDQITRRLLRIPDITIARHELKSMRRLPSGLDIRGNAKIIFVPSALDGYEDLISDLSHWGPIETRTSGPLRGIFLTYGVVALTLTAFAIVLTSANRRLNLAVGVPLALVLIWCFVVIQRSKYIDSRVKLFSWLVIAGPLMAILWVIAAALLVHD
jgi:hypothetical protein